MTTTTFVDNTTIIAASWLNDVDSAVYDGTAVYTPAGTGAVVTTVQAKLRETVSVLDFGADNTGVVDASTAFQNAINTLHDVFVPNGVYKLSTFILISETGQNLTGESPDNVQIIGGATHDLLRIYGGQVTVSGINFAPTAVSLGSPPVWVPIRIYGAWARIHNCRFLSPTDGSGTAIYMDDVNPATSAVVAGAYTHIISDNIIGTSTYRWGYGIRGYATTNGIQACKFLNNHIISGIGIYMYQGGGNTYSGNLLQGISVLSSNGIDLQIGVVGEMIYGNYFETQIHGVITRRVTEDYLTAIVRGNHWDNVTNPIQLAGGSQLISYFNESALKDYIFGWYTDYSTKANISLVNPSGSAVVGYNSAARSVEPQVSAQYVMQDVSISANSSIITPTSSYIKLAGNGAPYTGCYFANGTRPGQHLYIRGGSWSVQVLANPGSGVNAIFTGTTANVTFGNGASQLYTMHLMWDAGSNIWYEMSRSTV